MNLNPAAPDDFAALVDAYAKTTQAVIDLASSLRPGDAEKPTDCPGWTVRDQVAHVVSSEAMVAGEPVPELDVSGRAHVHSPLGEQTERGVESRRGRGLEELVEELEDLLAERLAVYRGPDLDREQAAMTPMGPGTLEELLGLRVFDIWYHEQDIREAIGRQGNLDSGAAAHVVSRVLGALPRVVARDAGIGPGHAVIIDVTGPVLGRAGVRVEERDGRPTGIPLFTGEAVDHADVETTTIALSTEALTRRAGGRRPTDEVHVTVTGDGSVARRVLDALAMTP